MSALDDALADLAYVERHIEALWEDLYAAEWTAESGRSSRARGSRPAWTEPGPVQKAYRDVVFELAKAHWLLGANTDVPHHWTVVPDTSERATTVPHSEALRWTAILGGMLRWLDERAPPPPAVAAFEEACAHVKAARGRIEDLWPPELRKRKREEKLCLHCTKRPAEKHRKWCAGCRRAHQRDRGRCLVCGLSVA